MADREKVIKGLEYCRWSRQNVKPEKNRCDECPYKDQGIMNAYSVWRSCTNVLAEDALTLLKEQENLKQKMWNALYAEEDNFENKYVRTVEHDNWFTVYRSWLQRGFEIAINVIAEQDGM